jgi:hypothetical protein
MTSCNVGKPFCGGMNQLHSLKNVNMDPKGGMRCDLRNSFNCLAKDASNGERYVAAIEIPPPPRPAKGLHEWITLLIIAH